MERPHFLIGGTELQNPWSWSEKSTMSTVYCIEVNLGETSYVQHRLHFKTLFIHWFRWRSSLWKLIWKELLAYNIVFISISVIYRLALLYTDICKPLQSIIWPPCYKRTRRRFLDTKKNSLIRVANSWQKNFTRSTKK
jgi:hypothetical protein